MAYAPGVGRLKTDLKKSIYGYEFKSTNLSIIDLPFCSTISDYAFNSATNLQSIYLTYCHIPKASSSAFNGIPKTTKIYVREKLYSKIITYTYWSSIAS